MLASQTGELSDDRQPNELRRSARVKHPPLRFEEHCHVIGLVIVSPM